MTIIYNMMYGYGTFGFFWMILFWIATKNKESTQEILEKRYAKGEINKKQYLEIKKNLRR